MAIQWKANHPDCYRMKYFLLPVASGLVLLLCGCPAQKPGAVAGASPQATAPSLSSVPAPAAEKSSETPSHAAAEGHAQSDQTLIAAANQAYDSGFALYQ